MKAVNVQGVHAKFQLIVMTQIKHLNMSIIAPNMPLSMATAGGVGISGLVVKTSTFRHRIFVVTVGMR